MPDTPAPWLSQFVANATTANSQLQPDIIQLSNGNILVSWTSFDDTGVGSPNSSDIIAQIYDPFGTAIGSEIRLNFNYSAHEERDATIAATTQGGFLVAYVDFETGAANDYRIAIDRYSADGTYEAGQEIDLGSEPLRDPQVAVSSATSALVAWIEDGTDDRVNYRIYDPSNNTVGVTEIAFVNGIGTGPISNLSVTTLTNGSYVIAAQSDNGTDDEIWLRIINAAGAGTSFVEIAATDGNGDEDSNPSVTALTGGNFVVVWENTDANDTDLKYQIFTPAGIAVGGIGFVNAGSATNDNNEPTVVALADGGFIIFYDDDELGSSAGRGQRFSATGATVGAEFTTDATNANDIQAILLDDGRVAVTWSNGEIQMEILDTRDFANTAIGTSGLQTGTVGDDTFTASTSATIVNAWDGNDNVTDANGTQDFRLGLGNDTMFVTSGIEADSFDGGDGIDTIDWSGSPQLNGTYNLLSGVATVGVNTEAMTNFENLITTNANDTAIGTSGANTINLLGGNDFGLGGGGNDVLFGGNGNDTLRGGLGNDVLAGGADRDTADYADSTFRVNVDLRIVGGQYVGADAGVDNIVSVENLAGGSSNDRLIGDGNNNTLIGNGDNDNLFGLGGTDILYGGTGIDGLYGGGGNDSLFGNAGNDRLFGGQGNDTLDGGDGADFADYRVAVGGVGVTVDLRIAGAQAVGGGEGIDTLISIENLSGSTFDDRLIGDANDNVLYGIEGNDTIFGLDGVDRISGGLGADSLYGGGGADVFFFLSTDDSNTASGRDTIRDFGVGGADRVNLSVIDANALIAGNQAFSFIGSSAFSGAGQARFTTNGVHGFVTVDVDGDGAADLNVTMIGITSMTAADFIL